MEYKIDWLEWTEAPKICSITEWLPAHPAFRAVKQLRPPALYAEAVQTFAGLRVMKPHEGIQGMRAIASGEAMQNLRDCGVSDMTMINYASRGARRVRRIDFAIDLYNNEAGNVADLTLAIERGECQTRAKKKTLIKDAAGAGYSQYVGSRSSDRMLRVYDKRTESGSKLYEAWTRIELQARHERAEAVVTDMLSSSIGDGGSAQVRAFVDFPTVEWWITALTSGHEVEASQVTRKDTQYERWIKEQVYPSLQRRIGTADEDIVTWLVNALKAHQRTVHDT